MHWIRHIAALAACAGLTACTTASAPPPRPTIATESRAPVTILVSIDGFRPDYLRRGYTPNLDALAAGGVQGEMRPSFPTLTFPNHEAMITGLYPDHNGVVSNTMYDVRRPDAKFTISDAPQATDPLWWDGGEPLWIAAEKSGIRTGVMFWPGVESGYDGKRPSEWSRYDANYLGDQRVRTVLDWMRRPAAIRPKLAIAYFDLVDKTGHKKGPMAPETLAAVRTTDAWIGDLLAGLRELGQPANIIIVSDHGMREVDPARSVLLGSMLPKGSYRWAQWGPFGAIDAMPGYEAPVAAALLKPNPLMQCWRKSELPARFHYGTHPRVAQFICLAQPGAEVVDTPPTNHGDHGYDPDDPDMAATFIASGPAIRPGAPAPAKFDNVDIYPLMRRLIGLPPAAKIDGSDAPFRGVLKE